MVSIDSIQAIVLAGGRGTRLTELNTDSFPKCLLPIGSKPMIWYPLNQLKLAKFDEVIVVIPDKFENEIRSKLEQECKFNMKLIFVTIEWENDWGTADSIRHLKDKIKGDVIVLSCDTITDFSLVTLINLHLLHESSVLVSAVPLGLETDAQPVRKGQSTLEKDFIGIDKWPSGDRLVFMSSEADFDESVPFRISIMKRCPEIEIRNDFLDCHVYVLNYWVVKYLVDNPSIISIKGELIPSMVRKQFRCQKQVEKVLNEAASIASSVEVKKHDIFDYINADELTQTLNDLELSPSDPTDTGSDEVEKPTRTYIYPNSLVKCFLYSIQDSFCYRANNISEYNEANQTIKRMNKYK